MGTIQSAIDGIKTSKEDIRTAINDKGGSLSPTAKLDTFASAVENLSTSMIVARNVKANSSSASSLTTDITLSENTTEALIVVTSGYSGNSNTYSCTKQSGANVTITTQQSNTTSNWGQYGQLFLFNTVTYKVTKVKGQSSVIRVSASNPYGLQGLCVHSITNG
jgi:hypothetical protein